MPGTVRLVKSSFLETDAVAWRRGSPELTAAYLALARRLVAAGHPVSFATHDEALVDALIAAHGDAAGAWGGVRNADGAGHRLA